MPCSPETFALHLNVSFIDASARRSISKRINFTCCIVSCRFKWLLRLSPALDNETISILISADDHRSIRRVQKHRHISDPSRKCVIPSLLAISQQLQIHLRSRTQHRPLPPPSPVSHQRQRACFVPARRATARAIPSRSYNRRIVERVK